jgi:ubiquinone/menaquinone biosynthesis C-methylase UbiE
VEDAAMLGNNNVAEVATVSEVTIQACDQLNGGEANSKFKNKSYWNSRFTSEDVYDWLVEFRHVAPQITGHLSFNDKILTVGCGNSSFSYELYQLGYRNIVNIDYSEVVIDNMAKKYGDIAPEMQWLVMDMTDMSFENNSFDVIIDKAAMDALVVDEGDVWHPSQHVIDIVDKMCTEVSRVLTRTGEFIQISFNQPHFRTKYLMGHHISKSTVDYYRSYEGRSTVYDWMLSFETISKEGGSLDTFLYLMNRKELASS